MKIFKNCIKEKKEKMTVDAFDTIIDNKKEKVVDFIKDNKMEVVGAGVMASLLILGCMKMRHSSNNSETVVIIINN